MRDSPYHFFLGDGLDALLREAPPELASARRALRQLAGYMGHCTIEPRGAAGTIECTRGGWFMRAAADYTSRHIAQAGVAGVTVRAVGRYLHTLAPLPAGALLLVVQDRRVAAPERSRRAVARVAQAARATQTATWSGVDIAAPFEPLGPERPPTHLRC